MSKRDFLDYTDMVGNSLEVFGESLRRTFDFDSYAGQNKFPAIVLTPPVPINSRQAGLFTKANMSDLPMTNADLYEGKDSTLNKLDKFMFRGRIVGPNSPHQFLPDPCAFNVSEASPPDALFKLFCLHTLFVSSDDFQLGNGKPFPTKGSIVLVELDQNQFGYNLEIGRLVSVLTKTNTYQNLDTVVGSACADMLASGDWSGLTIEDLTAEQMKQGMGKIGNPTQTNTIVSPYGLRIHPLTKKKKFHYGTDYAAARGDPLYSVSDGEVIRIVSKCKEGDHKCGTGWGNNIQVKHLDGYISVFAHITKSVVKVGDKVKAGDAIAQSGNTGASTGPHLHLVIYNKSKKKIDPEKYFKQRKAQAAAATT